MAGIVWGCIAPHGLALLAELSEDAEGAQATRAAMQELARRCAARAPEVLVVATPHGIRVDGAFSVAGGAAALGMLQWNGRSVELRAPLHLPLSDAVVGAARRRGLQVAVTSWGGNMREGSLGLLDWGAGVPVSFLSQVQPRAGASDVFAGVSPSGLPLVLVAPSRVLSRADMVAFGAAVAEAAADAGVRAAFVASCDWAHTHRADGPYGFHAAAVEVDRAVVAAVAANELERLLELPQEQAEQAAIDGLWQALMLVGAAGSNRRCELLSYQAPTYFGMLVAEVVPGDGPPVRQKERESTRHEP